MKQLYFFLLLLFASSSFAQLSPVNDSIPMRDGKYLKCTIHRPSTWTSGPVILIQTPYSRLAFNTIGLPLTVGFNINSSNYAFVIVDWRGFWGSLSAAYPGSPTRGEDGYDCVEWVAAQTWCNGKIGTWGPSALGKVQFQTAQENPPSLDCIVPLVAGPQFNYLEYYEGGALRTEYVEQLDVLGFNIGPVIIPMPVYNNTWAYVESINFYPDSIRVPTLMIGGWYDHNVRVMLDFYTAIRTNSPPNIQTQHSLLMGPWVHGGSGFAQVGSSTQGQLSYPTAAGWNDTIALRFLDYHLRNITTGWSNPAPYMSYFRMGENNWTSASQWPPYMSGPQTFYLHTNNTMDEFAPVSGTGSCTFNYDPNDPSPTIGGPTLRSDLDQGPYDQVPLVESRNDIQIFTTAPLTNPVRVNGPVSVHLKVSSNKYDTDFSVRLTDVYPDGRSMLVSDGHLRMRFRNGYWANDTSMMVPNTVYDAVIDLPGIAITFLAGHKIRLDITSSNYPRFNRNSNTGSNNMYPGNNPDSLLNPQIAQNNIFTNSLNASYIQFTVDQSTGMQEFFTGTNFNLYPNPSNGQFITIVSKEDREKLDLVITDPAGKIIMNKSGIRCSENEPYYLDIGMLANGLYLVRLGESTQKLIIQKR